MFKATARCNPNVSPVIKTSVKEIKVANSNNVLFVPVLMILNFNFLGIREIILSYMLLLIISSSLAPSNKIVQFWLLINNLPKWMKCSSGHFCVYFGEKTWTYSTPRIYSINGNPGNTTPDRLFMNSFLSLF